MGKFNDSERLLGEEVLKSFTGKKAMTGGRRKKIKWLWRNFKDGVIRQYSSKKNFTHFDDEKLKVIEINGGSFDDEYYKAMN